MAVLVALLSLLVAGEQSGSAAGGQGVRVPWAGAAAGRSRSGGGLGLAAVFGALILDLAGTEGPRGLQSRVGPPGGTPERVSGRKPLRPLEPCLSICRITPSLFEGLRGKGLLFSIHL